jgi:CRISPR-associated endonuclease Csy4
MDIRILPDPDFSRAHLLGALYSKLHRALVQLDANDIGVSFPQYSLSPSGLGWVLRLHASSQALQSLSNTDWLVGMRDHTELGSMQSVPPQAQHRQLLRRQFKTNVDRLRRRRARRKGESLDLATAAIPDNVAQQPNLPYVWLRSGSTKQSFCLFLEVSGPRPMAVNGTFNTYGLSNSATVPWF